MELTSQNVEKLFNSCLSKAGIFIEGKLVSARLDIKGHEQEIISLLLQLPEDFYASKGKGWSFHQANTTKSGIEWTSTYTIIEKLVLLGIVGGVVKYLPSKNFWQSLPGEMPYFVILDT
jgi:hypothetical protein